MKTNYFNIGDKVYILHEKGDVLFSDDRML